MSAGNEFLCLKNAAAVAHIEPNELKHAAQRGEIDASVRSGDWYFRRCDIDEWMQRRILSVREHELRRCHKSMYEEHRSLGLSGTHTVSALLREECIDLSIAAKAKAGLLRDMTDLAVRGGLVYDGEALYRELVAREEAASTATGEGAAFLHPRRHDPYLFEESFIAYGRCDREIFFGAPDGAGTRHFFLICATDRDLHLHILARLAVLAHGAALIDSLAAAQTAQEVLSAVRSAEAEYA